MKTRDDIIREAQETIDALPEWRRKELEREFSRAEEQAAWIMRQPEGPRQ